MMITYAIGDVHGRADLLHFLLKAIRKDAEEAGLPYKVVFLGDIIDRGSNSRMALELVIHTLAHVPGSKLILGNHEEFMLRYIEDPRDRDTTREHWLANGGFETLASYGLRGDEPDSVIIVHLKQHRTHIELLLKAENFVEDSMRFYVHAGVRPSVSLHDQTPQDLRWIRREFLDSTKDFGKIIVHGHTPTASEQPEVYPNRIAVDTKAFASGRLTAASFLGIPAPASFLCTEIANGEISIRRTSGERFT
ncbi:metallophosphoesterase [Rhizobiaceae bacterium n13]|uniref:Metallophosphoesterase n=1 Tax=Ferirhizobium litorale TaxID=2927786 RepID=A0AAE3QDC5_9HYPH|nr:metallophosphoesterase [Fererhizobium litorale]MDI7865152.1 metallophosphoesterase [Fererhizobium litorale]MDI7922876.1 metallophosphoesterase [Fererhizobium litorale]